MIDDFIAYLESEVKNHSIYVIGAQGQHGKAVTEAWIRKRETDKRNADRAVAFWKKQCASGYGDILGAFDCSGLGMYWLQNVKGLFPSDLNANGMKSKCDKLNKKDIRRGDWVFVVNNTGTATHIGYVVDDALNVIESRGRDYGVCKSALDRRWNYYGRPRIFKTEIEGEGDSVVFDKSIKRGDKGEEVRELQNALIKNGYSLPKYGADGSFGGETETAVKALQSKKGFTVDGVAACEEIEALGLVWHYKNEYNALLAEMRKIKAIADKY